MKKVAHELASQIPVVILCGGLGTRIQDGKDTKKELVESGNRPIIWHVMRIYSTFGFNHFVLPLGYGGDKIKRYFLDYEALSRDFRLEMGGSGQQKVQSYGSAEHDPWTIDFVDTGLETNRAARVKKVADFLNHERFMVTYGDGVGDVDIAKLLEFHLNHGRQATVTTIKPGHYQYGVLHANEAGIVTEYEAYPALDYWIDAGFMVFEQGVLQKMSDDALLDLAGDLLPELAAEGQLAMFRHYGFWQSMDTLKDMLYLEECWLKDAPWKVWE